MTLGGLLGLVLLKLFDSRKVLLLASLLAIVTLTLGLFGPAVLATLNFKIPAIFPARLNFYLLPGRLFASVMWPIIFSLALNSIETHQGAFSGLLCTGIAGGALSRCLSAGLETT